MLLLHIAYRIVFHYCTQKGKYNIFAIFFTNNIHDLLTCIQDIHTFTSVAFLLVSVSVGLAPSPFSSISPCLPQKPTLDNKNNRKQDNINATYSVQNALVNGI